MEAPLLSQLLQDLAERPVTAALLAEALGSGHDKAIRFARLACEGAPAHDADLAALIRQDMVAALGEASDRGPLTEDDLRRAGYGRAAIRAHAADAFAAFKTLKTAQELARSGSHSPQGDAPRGEQAFA
jgi:hypothetical protein